MEENNILVTGGSGLLGTELKKLMPNAIYPSHSDFNIEHFYDMKKYIAVTKIVPKVIFHGAAFTSPPKIDENPATAIIVNNIGTSNLTILCMVINARLIYMSTDYVFKGDRLGCYEEEEPVYPVNKYAWSKLGGECAVRMYDNSLIIRASFGPRPFPYDKAFIDQNTSREYVDEIAPKIVELIKSDLTGVIHLGKQKQTVYNYAKETRPDVQKLKRKDVNFKVPKDTSLNTERYKLWTKI